MSRYLLQRFARRRTSKASTQQCAAEYLRASTDHQELSVENQHVVIADYADRHGLSVVRSYTDPGRTGLTFRDRPGLKQLISDIQSGEAPFQVVLVFDVSRWGRFQDTDESAYYEFLCRSNGIAICYCLEQFENDGSLINSLMKSLKRAMAGEFSRDLSHRVWLGQKKIISLGYSHGGTASYGLRRMLVDAHGKPRGILNPATHKYLSDDRVKVVPGPEREIAVVREIFKMYVDGKSKKEIARILNGRKLVTARGKRWSDCGIDGVLRNERYIGNLVYNRSSMKLGSTRIVLPESDWIRADGVIQPIVSQKLFNLAKYRLARARPPTDNDLLNYLTATWCVSGNLSMRLIDKDPMLPCPATFIQRFGSLYNACRLVGFKRPHQYRTPKLWPILRCLDREITGQAIDELLRAGRKVSLDDDAHVLTVDGWQVALALVPFTRAPPQIAGWRLQLKYVAPCSFIMMALLDRLNKKVDALYLLPRQELVFKNVYINDRNVLSFRQYLLPSLAMLPKALLEPERPFNADVVAG
jgi:DNA invertase Pin-like site-specific DNA recombinase